MAVDSNGAEFVPSTVVYCEGNELDIPAVGDRVKIGQHSSATPPSDAEMVRKVVEHDPTTFGEVLADKEVMAI